jgi:hypothetical protein
MLQKLTTLINRRRTSSTKTSSSSTTLTMKDGTTIDNSEDEKTSTSRHLLVSDTLMIGTGGSSSYKELFIEQNECTTVRILGVDPQNSNRLKQHLTSSVVVDNMKHCPYPLYLDNLNTNHALHSTRITKVASGSIHTLYLTEDQTCYSLGYNADSELGAPHTTNLMIPHLIQYFVENNIRIKDIACGGWFSAWVSTVGDLYLLGRIISLSGSVFIPQKIFSEERVVVMGCGNEWIVFQTESHKVYSVGESGQYNAGTTGYNNKPVQIEYYNQQQKRFIPFDFPIRKIDGGEKYGFIQAQSGQMYFTGSLTFSIGTSGDSKTLEGYFLDPELTKYVIKDFSCTWTYPVFLDAQGRIFTYSSMRQLQFIDTSHLTTNPMIVAGACSHWLYAADKRQLYRLSDHEHKLTEPLVNEYDEDITAYQPVQMVSGYFTCIILLNRSRSLSLFFTRLHKQVSENSPLSDITIHCKH